MNIIRMGEAKFNVWFQKHLHWAWVLALMIELGMLALWVSEDNGVGGLEVILLGLAQLVVSGRVVIGKGRSLWWLLLSPLFSPLWLSNRMIEK